MTPGEGAERDGEGGDGRLEAEAYERDAKKYQIKRCKADEGDAGEYGERGAEAALVRHERACERMELHPHQDEETSHDSS